MANANDAKVTKLRAEIEKKRAALKNRSSRFSPITNASLELSGVRYNLHTLDLGTAMLLGSQLQAVKNGAEDLFFDTSFVLISGFSVRDWVLDVLARIESISVKDEETKLHALDARLKELLSADAKTDIAVQEIEALLR